MRTWRVTRSMIRWTRASTWNSVRARGSKPPSSTAEYPGGELSEDEPEPDPEPELEPEPEDVAEYEGGGSVGGGGCRSARAPVTVVSFTVVVGRASRWTVGRFRGATGRGAVAEIGVVARRGTG